jgi:hypothetical protein
MATVGFEVAQQWLDSQRVLAQRNNPHNNSVSAPAEQAAASGARSASSAEQPKPDTALYQEFMRWRHLRGQ